MYANDYGWKADGDQIVVDPGTTIKYRASVLTINRAVDYMGHGGTVITPTESTVKHKAKVGSTWSTKTGKLVDDSWTECGYEWDGAAFSAPIYT